VVEREREKLADIYHKKLVEILTNSNENTLKIPKSELNVKYVFTVSRVQYHDIYMCVCLCVTSSTQNRVSTAKIQKRFSSDCRVEPILTLTCSL
jgi:hypothetical protein